MIGIGSRVTCTDDAAFGATQGETLPVKGNTYTVRSISNNCLRLNEIVNAPKPYVGGTVECAFRASRFAEVPPPTPTPTKPGKGWGRK
jgi:hypothetical protein